MEQAKLEELIKSFGGNEQTLTWLIPIIGAALVLGIIAYIYTAIATQEIAKKLNHQTPWLAWIPIANIVQLWQISGLPQWTLICYFIAMAFYAVPVIGTILAIGATIIAVYWYWTICEKLNRPGWWSLFSVLFTPAWLVMLGIMAWSDTAPSAPSTPTPQV